MRKNRTRIKYLVILGLVLSVSIGYAYLSSSLNITGFGHLNRSVWSVYFYDLRVTKGESLGTISKISNTKTTSLEYSVNFTKPGDVFQFNVDVINNGTMDAMISLINRTKLTDEQKKFADFSIMYEDGSELEEKNFLGSKSSETFTVTVSYKKNINVEDLPSSETSIDFLIDLEYTQAKESDNRKNKSLIIKDLSENGNDAVLVGGKKNSDNTVTFDGVNDFMDLGLENYDFGESASFVVRAKFNGLDESNYYYELFSNKTRGKGLRYAIEFEHPLVDISNTNGKPDASYRYANMTYYGMKDNTWYTLVLTYDGTHPKFYVNGSSVALPEDDLEDNGPALGGGIIPSSAPLIIGNDSNSFNYKHYGSYILDSVLVFDRVLTDTEISNNYKGVVNPVDTTDMLMYYNFE